MLLIGAMLSLDAIPPAALWFVPLLLLVIRPVAVNLGMIGSTTRPSSARLSAGSVFAASARSTT